VRSDDARPTAGSDPRDAAARDPGRPRRGLALALVWVGLALMGIASLRVGQYTLGDGLVLLVGALVVTQLLTGDRRGLAPARARRSSQLVLVGTLLLLVAGTLSSFGSWDPQASLLIIARVAYLTLVWFWILRAVTPNRAAIDTLLSGWRIGVVIVAMSATLGELGLAAASTENAEGRQTAFSGHPNDLAGFLVIAVPLVVLGLPRREGISRRRRVTWQIVLTGLVFYGISTSGSMTGFASGFVALVATYAITALIPSSERRRRHPLAIMLGIMVAIGGVIALANSDLPVVERYERFESGDSYVTGSAETRGQLNEAVLGSFDKWLVTGVGMDFESVYATGFFSERLSGGIHNMYLKVLLEAGLPALIGLLLIIGATFRAAFMLVVNTRGTRLYPVAVAATASMIGACTFANFGPILYQRYFWLPMAIVWCLWSVRREELARGNADAIAGRQASRGASGAGDGGQPGGQPQLGAQPGGR